jgi:hypothetical protein
MATPCSVAIPMVALNFFALTLASALWVRMPLGKKRALPLADSTSYSAGFSLISWLFNSSAKGFIEDPYRKKFYSMKVSLLPHFSGENK